MTRLRNTAAPPVTAIASRRTKASSALSPIAAFSNLSTWRYAVGTARPPALSAASDCPASRRPAHRFPISIVVMDKWSGASGSVANVDEE